MSEAAAVGVDRIVTIGTGRASSERALAYADAHPAVFAAIGVHPHDADAFGDEDLDWMRALAAHPKVVAIGECGLDYHYDHSERTAQLGAFVAQIELAREVGLPIVIHTREAADDTFALLRERAAGMTVVLHCFSLPERVEEVIAEGWMASFAGPITFPRNDALREAARALPDDRILVETDSPYLAPVPRRGRPNRPANVVHTLAALAEVRGATPEHVDRLTTSNAARALGI